VGESVDKSAVGLVVGDSVEETGEFVGGEIGEGDRLSLGDAVFDRHSPPSIQQLVQHPGGQITSSTQSAMSSVTPQSPTGTTPVKSFSFTSNVDNAGSCTNSDGIVPVS
jgi:hypothetical protein